MNENTQPSPDKKLEILRRIETKLNILLGKKDAQEITRSSGEVVIQNYSALGNPVNPTEIKVEEIPF